MWVQAVADPQSEVLAPTPAGMAVEVTHSGVRWRTHTSPVAIWVALLGLATTTIMLGVGSFIVSGVPWLGAIPVLLAVPIGLQLSSTTLVLTDRAVTVRVRQALSTRVERFPLDEITHAGISHPHGDPVLVVRSEESSVGLGRGQPEAYLEWVVGAIDVPRAGFHARERVEGREWSFMRKTPEDLQALRGGPSARTEEPPTPS